MTDRSASIAASWAPEIVVGFLIVCALAAGALMSPNFLAATFLLDAGTLYAELGLVALTTTMVIVSGEIDLSVASMIALSACIFAVCVDAQVPFAVSVAAGLASGALMGLVNGLLVVGCGLPSLITTIGTAAFFRGLADVLLGDRSVTDFPAWWIGIDDVAILGIPAPVLILAAAAALAAVLLHATVFGRRVVLIGVNASAARYAGIGIGGVKTWLFALNGLACAVAGLMMSSRLGVVRHDLASGAELQIILIAIVGGTSVAGGRGTIGGTFAAFWLLVLIQTGMILADIGIERQLIVLGATLVVAIIASRLSIEPATKNGVPRLTLRRI